MLTPAQAITAYQEAAAKLSEAQVHKDNAQQQFDAVQNAKAVADANAADAVKLYNASIDAAVDALKAAKIGAPLRLRLNDFVCVVDL